MLALINRGGATAVEMIAQSRPFKMRLLQNSTSISILSLFSSGSEWQEKLLARWKVRCIIPLIKRGNFSMFGSW